MKDATVTFVDYRLPHTQDDFVVVHVRTDGTAPPHVAFTRAATNISRELDALDAAFSRALVDANRMQ